MTSLLPDVLGSQVPRLHLRPEADRTDGGDAAALAAGYGLDLDPWQRLILDDWLAVGADGRRAASTCWLSVPRQNGKTGITEAYALFALAILGERLLYTAQELPGARRFFNSLLRWFGRSRNDRDADHPELNALVEKVSHTNGREGIYLTNGGRIEFSARTGRVFRGGSIDALILDEAQLHTDEYHEALGPALRASPDAQKVFLGTPPDAAHRGELFARMRDVLVDGSGERLAAAEWSPDPEADPYSLEAARQSNPALGIRVSWSDMQEAAANNEYSLEGYQRELLGSWLVAGGAEVIPADDWAAIGNAHAAFVGPISIGIDMSQDRTSAAVALAGETADGEWLVAMREHKTGPTDWVVPFVKSFKARNTVRAVVIDKASAAASLVDQFERERVKITTTAAADMADACGKLFDGVYSGWLVHTAQPQLAYALSQARKRDLLGGGAWGWNKKTSESDITPVVAVTLALWGARHSNVKKNPNPNPDRTPGRAAGRRVGAGRVAGRR